MSYLHEYSSTLGKSIRQHPDQSAGHEPDPEQPAPDSPRPPDDPPAPAYSPEPEPPVHPTAPHVKPDYDPDIPEHPGPPLSDPESPHGGE